MRKTKNKSKNQLKVDELYKNIKSNYKKDAEYKKTYASLKQLKSEIQGHEAKIDKLESEFRNIHSKDLPDNVVERFPIEDLHDLSGKNENKATLSDAIRLGKIQKEIENLLEEYDIMYSKKKMLEVELLQVKINSMINYGDK